MMRTAGRPPAARRLAALATWLGLALAAPAVPAAPPQTVYRCGPDGRVYSQTPCADGRPMTVDDPRTPGQRQEAADVARRETKAAQQLADERRQREAAARGQPAIGIKPDAPAAPASAPPKAKPKKEPLYVGPPASQSKGRSDKAKAGQRE
jgi:hypothetical protein